MVVEAMGLLTFIVWDSRWYGYPRDEDTDVVALYWLACVFDVGDGRDCITVLCGLRLAWAQCFSFLISSISPNPIPVLLSPCSSYHPLLHFSPLLWVQHFGGTYRRVLGYNMARLGSRSCEAAGGNGVWSTRRLGVLLGCTHVMFCFIVSLDIW